MGFIPLYTIIIFNPLVALFAVHSSALFILGMVVIYFLGGYTGYWVASRLKLTDEG